VQASCPQCAQKIVIDDAKVPERAFSVRCPKCQATVRFPGKAPAAEAAPPPPFAPPEAVPPSLSSPPVADEVRTQLMAQLRREMTLAGGSEAGSLGRALVTLPDRSLAGTLTVMLSRVGYAVDAVEDWDEASRLVEQGNYAVALTTRAPAAAGRENLFQRVARLSPDNRRRLFLGLVGDEWKTGDGLQAFLAACDLVINTRDAGNVDALFISVVHEKSRIYQVYLDARARHQATP
jgi:predicted Zn finger-like uncharacterized protein